MSINGCRSTMPSRCRVMNLGFWRLGYLHIDNLAIGTNNTTTDKLFIVKSEITLFLCLHCIINYPLVSTLFKTCFIKKSTEDRYIFIS